MSRLPVLMYHNVSVTNSGSSGLTISLKRLEEQFAFLSRSGYTSFFPSELQGREHIPEKSIIITFDDVTENQLQAIPLLKQYNLKAAFFIPFHYIGKTDSWNKGGEEQIMTIEQLISIDSDVAEFGYHSYLHRPYAQLTDDDIYNDFKECNRIIAETGLKVYPSVAYPYGNYPKKEPAKAHFKQTLQQNGIAMGFKIGNRVNKFPFADNYEIQRLDIKGEDSLLKFRLKLRFGKLKLF